MRTAGYPTSPAGIHSAAVTSYTNDLPANELDDEPLTTTPNVTPQQLPTYPYKFRLTLPANSPATAGLLLLAIRQAPWTSPIPEESIPNRFFADLRQTLLRQVPTIIRTSNASPKPARDLCTIYSPTFACLSPKECLRHFRAATLHTIHGLLTAAEYRQPHEIATMANHLSPHPSPTAGS